MPDDFRALVLGGSGAVGREVVRLLREDACRVAFTYHAQEAIATQTSSAHVVPLRANLDSAASTIAVVQEACERLGGLDALIHCAAICLSEGDAVPTDSVQRIGDIHEAGWQRLMAININSVFFACQAALPSLQARGGNIVLFSSISGVKSTPSPVIYATSKAALVGMTHSMAKELGKDNIRINCIAPGLLETGVSTALPRALRDEYLKHCGLKREGKPEEIARVAVWLARDNTYITGQTILVDGAV